MTEKENTREHIVILGFKTKEDAEKYFNGSSYKRIKGCNMASQHIKHTKSGFEAYDLIKRFLTKANESTEARALIQEMLDWLRDNG